MLPKPKEPSLQPLISVSTVFMDDCQDASSENGTQLYSTKHEIISFLLPGISHDRIVKDCKPLCGGRIVKAFPIGDFWPARNGKSHSMSLDC
jgi:hypothetical protein